MPKYNSGMFLSTFQFPQGILLRQLDNAPDFVWLYFLLQTFPDASAQT
jgi:hypothetical protein